MEIMANLTIQLPVFDAERKIEIDVTINGSKKRLHYRVELFDWSSCEEAIDKASCLKQMINAYDPNWQVVQIGEANEQSVQIMFREKAEHNWAIN